MREWIQKALSLDWLFPRIPLEEPEQSEEEVSPLHSDHQVILNRINHARLVNNHSAGDIHRLEVLCRNADDYIELLTVVKSCLMEEEPFPRKEYGFQQVKVCNFYQSQDGTFSPIVSKRGALLKIMEEVVLLHQELSKRASFVGNSGHLLRRSLVFMISIDKLSLQMVTSLD